MAQKRPPLPIFNKNKRPRRALVAHPNNAPGHGHSQQFTPPAAVPQRNYQQSYRQPSAPVTPYTHGQPYPSQANNRSSYYHGPHGTASGQENRAPSTASSHYASSHYTPSASQPQPPNYRQRQSTTHGHYGAPSRSNFPPQRLQKGPSMNPAQKPHYVQSQFVRQHTDTENETARLQLNTSTGSSTAMASAAGATGTAKEPSRDMAAQHNTSTARPESLNSKRMKPSLRVLTATAQGMKHWSQFKKYSPLLFEVFGKLSSPTTLVRGHSRCKQFQLSTVDGPVKCIYWEMGECLPPLVQGHTLRVVGQWDGTDDVMQCYSVREAVNREEELAARKAVEVSDRSMRQMVAELSR